MCHVNPRVLFFLQYNFHGLNWAAVRGFFKGQSLGILHHVQQPGSYLGQTLM